MLSKLLEDHSPRVLRPFTEQLCWRTYWKGWLERRPEAWNAYLDEVNETRESLSPEQFERLCAAHEGKTGVACFDQWNAELRSTGYLHNHARMWYASIWIFTLELPWSLGAAHFLRHLLDGDPASNTLSWRWVGGLHTPGKHYVARAANIAKYTAGRFEPHDRLNETPFPLKPGLPFCLDSLEERDPLGDARYPGLSESPVGLLLTAEDLAPEVGPLVDAPLHSIAAFSPLDVYEAIDLAPEVVRFKEEALRDAARRGARHWGGPRAELREASELPMPVVGGVETVGVDAPMRVYVGQVGMWVPSVVAWARRERLRSVRMYEPPVGPWRDRIRRLRVALRRHGIDLKLHRRPWDTLHWPHATAGYFKFRKGLEGRLSAHLLKFREALEEES
ncbi:MAG: FAD-binding domain-containing protein [Opitutales bacterium]